MAFKDARKNIKKGKDKTSEIVSSVIALLITLILPVLILYVFFISIPDPDQEEYRITNISPIVSLKVTQEVNASFFLGTGEKNGTQYFKFYKTTERGSLKLTQMPVSSLELNRSDTETPALVTYQKFHKYTIPWKIFINGEDKIIENDTYQVLVIPSNAIEIQYDITL